MYAIIFFGALMIVISGIMIISPAYWSHSIKRFSQMPYFHLSEIITRLVAGVIFVVYAAQTQSPTVITIVGYIFLAVGGGLMLTPPSAHRRFAVWSVEKFQKVFRPAGVVSLLFGIFLIYSAL